MKRIALFLLLVIGCLTAEAQFNNNSYSADNTQRSMLYYTIEDMRIHMPKKVSDVVILTNVYYDQNLNEVRLSYTYADLDFDTLDNPKKELREAVIDMLASRDDNDTRTFVQLMKDARCSIRVEFTDMHGKKKTVTFPSRNIKLSKITEESR